MNKYKGTVENGKFRLESGELVRVTSIRPQEAVAPTEMDLGKEGSTLTIEGDLQGGWIYSASVIRDVS